MARHGWEGSNETFTCAQCGTRWRRPTQGGRAPKFCSDACKQQAYRDRVRQQAAASSSSSGRGSGGASGTRGRSSAGTGSSSSYSSGHQRAGRDGYRDWRGFGQGGSSYSSWSAGAGGRSSAGSAGGNGNGFRERDMTVAEARRTIFRIAGVADDGHRTVKSAYRTASRKLHPDTGATKEQEELFKLLSLAKTVLAKAGLFG